MNLVIFRHVLPVGFSDVHVVEVYLAARLMVSVLLGANTAFANIQN